MKHALLIAVVTILVAGGPGALLLACGETAGRRVTFETVAVSEANTFKNAFGWEITLDEALLATGPLYYFEGTPGVTLRSFFLKRAWAHPGHYVAGDARGEMTTSWTIDLLARNVLPRGRGVTGALRSARFGFGWPPSGPHANALAGHIVRVAAHATRDGKLVTFHATADLDQVVDPDSHPQVESCVFRAADVQRDGLVTLTIKPSVWFDQVELADASGDLANASSVYNAFARGLKKSGAYTFAYEPR